MDIQVLRDELKVVRRLAYFQTGTLGPAPRAAVRAAQEHLEQINDAGPAHLPNRAGVMARVEAARQALADVLGCEAGELGFTQNTSQSLNMVALAHRWRAGDEVIITDLEHPANIIPWQLHAERSGLRLKVTPGGQPDALPALISRLITRHTRLVSVCHVSPLTGAVLPVKEICDAARARGVPTVVDGAQATGAIPVSVRAIGCDFYVGSGHKWLLGLPGIGYLYVRCDALPDFRPSWAGPGTGDYLAGHVTWNTAASKIEFGSRDNAVLASLADSLAFLNQVGMPLITQRVATLAAQLRAELQRIPGVQILTPPGVAGAAGITTFRLANGRHADLVDYLLECHRVLVKVTKPTRDSVRVSTHFFNTEAEVDTLVRGLLAFLAGGGPAPHVAVARQ